MLDRIPPRKWDQEADIVVVGSGFAGLAAAIEAKQAGSSVAIIEKMKGYGGNSAGRVCGVLLRKGYAYPAANSGNPKTIKARQAVILATGGFTNDIPLRTSQDPRLTSEIGSTNKFSTSGEGLREALRIGAMPVHLSWIQLGPWASPDEKGYGGRPRVCQLHGLSLRHQGKPRNRPPFRQ